MSALIESTLTMIGVSIYAVIRNSTGQLWNGSTFETFNVSNWATYAIPLVEQTSTGYYKANFPSGIPAGFYTWVIHQGASPTLGDQPLDNDSIDWSGSVRNTAGTIVLKLPTGSISGFDPLVDDVDLNPNQTGVTIGTVENLGATALGDIKDQLDSSLNTDVISELSSSPSSTPSLKQALMFLFMALRNKRTSDATTVKVYNASGAVIATATQSDNSSIYTKENFA
jgi:hypothetical protein